MIPLSKSKEKDHVTKLADHQSLDPKMTRSARAQFRPTPDQKDLFMRAATLEGRSLSEFIRIAVEERAKNVIAEHERIILTDEARNRFFIALTNPPDPSDKLSALADRYAQEVKSRP